MALAETFQSTRPSIRMREGMLRGVFDLVKLRGTDSERQLEKPQTVKIKAPFRVLAGQVSLTSATESLSATTSNGIQMVEDDLHAAVPAIMVAGAAWRAAANDLAYARKLLDGWKGPGSLKPSKSAIDDAASILSAMASALATAPRPVAPALGVDAGGEVVMSWSGRDGLFGSMSISGDGTFAFYVERGDSSAEDGDLPITGSLPKSFIDVLLGEGAGHE